MGRPKKVVTDGVEGDVVEQSQTNDTPVTHTLPEHVTVPPVAQINVQDLMAALIAAREAGKPKAVEEDKTLHKLELVRGIAVYMEDKNSTKDNPKFHKFEKLGDHVMLPRQDILDLKDRYKKFFDKGYLSAPTVLEDNPAYPPDIDNLIDTLSIADIDEVIGKMDSVPTLFDIYHHIENRRFTHLDEAGRPLTEQIGAQVFFRMEENKLDSRVRAIETAVKLRLEELTHNKIALDN